MSTGSCPGWDGSSGSGGQVGVPGSLERLPDTHAECVSVLALRKVCSEVELVLCADCESQSATASWKNVIATKVSYAGRHFTETREGHDSESPGQCQTVLQLSG